MKEGIHPKYQSVVFRDASNGKAFLSRSTMTSDKTIKWEDGNEYPLINLEISSTSHPFYTGTQRLLDTAGRVERFQQRYGMKKQESAEDASAEAEQDSGSEAEAQDNAAEEPAAEAAAPEAAEAEAAPEAAEAEAAAEAPAAEGTRSAKRGRARGCSPGCGASCRRGSFD